MAFRVDPRSPASQGLAAPVEGEGEDMFTGVDPESMFGYGENSLQYAEAPFYDAETLFQNALNTSNEEVDQNFVSISFFFLSSFFLQPPQNPLNNESYPTTTHNQLQQTISTWPTPRMTANFTYWQMWPWAPICNRISSKLTQQHRRTHLATGSSQLTRQHPKFHRMMMNRRLKSQPIRGPPL